MQAASGVYENHIVGGKFCFAHGAANDFERLVGSRAGPHRSAGGFGVLRELLARGGPIHVRGNDDGTMAIIPKPFAELTSGCGFAGALQADDEPDRRRARGEMHANFLAEKFGQFVANDFDDLLIGRKLEKDFGAKGLFADVRDDFVNDAEIDVCVEKGFANLREAGVEMLFGDFALAAKILERALEFVGEIFKHGLDETRFRIFMREISANGMRNKADEVNNSTSCKKVVFVPIRNGGIARWVLGEGHGNGRGVSRMQLRVLAAAPPFAKNASLPREGRQAGASGRSKCPVYSPVFRGRHPVVS